MAMLRQNERVTPTPDIELEHCQDGYVLTVPGAGVYAYASWPAMMADQWNVILGRSLNVSKSKHTVSDLLRNKRISCQTQPRAI